jgi:diguanylate cyclase (GGDEF)-like protein
MSDSETAQNDPEPERGAVPSAGGPIDGPGEQGAQEPVPPVTEPQSSDGGAEEIPPPSSDLIPPPSSQKDGLASFKRLLKGRNAMWTAVAVLCVAAGVAGSVLGAHAVARNDAAQTRQAFHLSVTATGIASSVKVALQHEEDLVESSSTFFAGNPKATPGEFSGWMRWTHALRRYPELQKLGFVAYLRTPEPASTAAARTVRGLRPLAGSSALVKASSGRTGSAAKPSYYCSAVAQLSRSSAHGLAVGGGHCTVTPGLLSSRDSGVSIYSAPARGKALEIVTPVYRGVLPSSVVGRRAAFVGWLHEVLAPGVVLRAALHGHPGSAVRLRYRAGPASVAFTEGTQQRDAQSMATNLQNGWAVRSFGGPAGGGVFTDGDALALLIAGIVLSALLGLLVFVLGTARPQAPVLQRSELPGEDLYDALTGLPNRTLTLDRAERMVARAGRDSGMLAGALFVDIDRLKEVNEKLGQAASDQLLRIVGERLEVVVRAHDTVGRLGGDEFVVLVESAARGVRLDSLAQRMIEALHKPVELDDFGPSFVLTASIGVAFGRYATVDDLLRDAHLALTSAKAAGKDRYTLFNANMRTIIEGRAVLEAELNIAIQETQFFLLYQPIYDLGTRRAVGLQALIRWQHPVQGVLAPGDFIQLAEDTGLIVPIGRWMLEEACTRAAAWNVTGHPAGISVKVSAAQLNRDGFATDVQRALQQSGIEPSLLTLEIAETTVMRDLQAAAQRLAQIKQLGVRIAIDDFGSEGYAHHSDLGQVPLDSLRVDRNSLAPSEDEAYRSWLLEAILTVGREHSLTVTATGVETDEQLSTLRALGCTMAQGALLAKPAPVEAVEGLLDADLPAPRATFTSLPSFTSLP